MDKRILCMILLIGVAFGLNVSMSLPEKVAVNQNVGAFVEIHGNSDKFDVAIFLPEGWNVKEWNVESYDKNWVSFEIIPINIQGKSFEVAHWKFEKKIVDYAKLYFVFIPKDSGSYDINGFWTTPGGFGKIEGKIEVLKPVCGNGICEVGESSSNCPQDCGIGKGIFILSFVILVIVAFFVWLIIKKVKE